jgi:hypothetical protein
VTLPIANVASALAAHERPTVVRWNRIEGRPRAADFGRALRTEFRDPLWALTRQWQTGGFQGEDAGSPVAVRLHLATTRFTRFRAREHPAEPLGDLPLEAVVERRPLPLTLDLRALMGRQWLKLVRPLGPLAAAFVARYPFTAPDPSLASDAPLCAHPEVWQSYAAAAGRLMDGGALYTHLRADPGHRAYDGMTVQDALKGQLDALGDAFVRWFDDLFLAPAGASDAWDPSRLEYRFACSAPDGTEERVLAAREYAHGELDWHTFDRAPAGAGLGAAEGPAGPDPRAAETRAALPVPVAYGGMPNRRWWAFEDARTSFAQVKPETTDLGRLLLLEFALVYANDWFVVPCDLAVGSLATVRGLAVTNTFGERYWIEAAGGEAGGWRQRWSMFATTREDPAKGGADPGLLLMPRLPGVLEGPPLEAAVFIRDEMANMVWAVERTVLLATGDPRRGSEAADETRGLHQRLLREALAQGSPAAAPLPEVAPVRYEAMSGVPENWIPFIPVRVPGDVREIQLQRAAMPRVLDGDIHPPAKVRPRTSLVRQGLDQHPPAPYFLHEEEVPRAGILVTQSFQRTRWLDGRTYVWVGTRKQTAGGEGSSGLAFDRIVPSRPEVPSD